MNQRMMLGVFLCLAAVTAAAQPCSVEDLKGAYLLQTSGWVNPAAMDPTAPAMSVPFAGLGIVMYDGKGKGSGRFTHAVAGKLSDLEFVDLTYRVGDNCRGEATYRFKDLESGAVRGPEKMALTLSDDGHMLRSISVDTQTGGIVLSEQSRIDRSAPACATDLIQGTYTMKYSGWLNAQALNPSSPSYFMPVFGLASFQFEPGKSSTGGGTHNFGGMIFTTTLKSATWMTGESCVGTVSLVAHLNEGNTDSTMVYPFVVLDGGNRIVVLAGAYSGFMEYVRESTR